MVRETCSSVASTATEQPTHPLHPPELFEWKLAALRAMIPPTNVTSHCALTERFSPRWDISSSASPAREYRTRNSVVVTAWSTHLRPSPIFRCNLTDQLSPAEMQGYVDSVPRVRWMPTSPSTEFSTYPRSHATPFVFLTSASARMDESSQLDK